MSNLMIITVGTSLFHSASWDERNTGFLDRLGSQADNYKDNWANARIKGDIGNLYKPDDRKIECPELVLKFKELLTADNAKEYAQYAADYQEGDEMRYSAELATILAYARQMNPGNWKQYLSDYEIVFVIDEDENNPSHIAAVHNAACLAKIAGLDDKKISAQKISYLSSIEPDKLKSALLDFQKYIHDEKEANQKTKKYQTIDLIVSGGYKIYGFVSFREISADTQLIYMHEAASKIFIHQPNAIIADGVAINLDNLV